MISVKSSVGKVMDSMVYAISDGINSNFFLIDIGDFEAARSLLHEGSKVCGVFLTHGHHDHVFGLNRLIESFPQCKVYASEDCARMLASSKANLSAYIEMPFVYEGEVSILHDGDQVELFHNVLLTAFATPGHNPSCMSFIIDDYLFTGDSYIPGVKVVTNLPGGSKLMAQKSVEKITNIAQGKIICPGHKVD